MSTQQPGQVPQSATLTSLPSVEDLPVSTEGYDQAKVREAFDAFRRHALQLQAQLRVFQAAGGAARVEPTAHAVRMDALHLIRTAAEFADQASRVAVALDGLRRFMAARLDLVPADQWSFLWVTEMPLVEWNDAERRWDPVHHPFTAPRVEDEALLESDPGAVRSRAYDVVMNGWELGGGSIRIHRPDLQRRVFSLIGIDEERAEQRFGWFVRAFDYGAPPHGGIAFGIDRIVALLAGKDNIRDVIAFPKTSSFTDLLTGAPDTVEEAQLKELGLRVVGPGGGPGRGGRGPMPSG